MPSIVGSESEKKGYGNLAGSNNSLNDSQRYAMSPEKQKQTSKTQSSSATMAKPAKTMRQRWKKFGELVKMDTIQAYRGAKRNLPQYLLGCGSVFLVVSIVAILLTAISYAPAVFLSLAESVSGELDMVVYPSGQSQFGRINYTALQTALAGQKAFTVPRISNFFSQVYDVTKCQGYDSKNPTANRYTYEGPAVDTSQPQTIQNGVNSLRNKCASKSGAVCASSLCPQPKTARVYVIDTDLEKSLKIGRSWPFPAIPSGSCLIHRTLARTMKLNKGDYVVMSVWFKDFLPTIYLNAVKQMPSKNSTTQNVVNMVLKIADLLETNYGKLPISATDSIFVEKKFVASMIANNLPPYYDGDFNAVYKSFATESNVNEAVTDVTFLCDEFRISCYMDTNYNTLSKKIIDWASDVVYNLDYRQLTACLPVLSELSNSKLLAASLNLIFSIVVLMMGGLSIFLIYSLLMVSVETRTFELGVFRMIGLTKNGLILMILIQALMYAIPGWAIGMITSQIAWLILRNELGNILKAELGYFLASDAVWMATILGIFAPILASVLPIRQALSQNLHDSLDSNRSKTKAVVFSIERTSGQSISTELLAVGLLMTVLGFLIYYLLPMAMIYNNIALLFNIFLALLISMLLGLVMLSLNLQPVLEKGLVWIFFKSLLVWESTSMPTLVVKNLVAHRMRNRKTSIMYATALGFIIFMTTAIRIELQSLMFSQMRKFGADLQLGIGTNVMRGDIPTGLLNINAFEEYCRSEPLITGFSYRTFFLEQINTTMTSHDMISYGRTVTTPASMVGITPNYYDVPNQIFTLYSDKDPNLNNAYTLSEKLYLKDAQLSAHIGTLMKTNFNLKDFDEKFIIQLRFTKDNVNTYQRTPLRASAFMNSVPALTFGQYPSTPSQDMTIGFVELMKILNGTVRSMEYMPMSTMYIKTSSATTSADTKRIMADLSRLVMYETPYSLDDVLVGLKDADGTLAMIFQIVTIAAMAVAFFSLNSSMVTNIFEQKKEIGVLRALGLQKSGIFRLFIYEAFFLIMSAACLGTLIGVVVGWSMAAQRSVVTDVPLSFVFPMDIFGLVFSLSIICAVLATLAPISRLVYGESIVSIIRG